MTDLLVFYPQGGHLIIEFLGGRYIERQPRTPAETELFLNSVKPVVFQLDEYVLKHNLKEIIELNLKDVPVAKLNSKTALHLIKLMIEIRPDKHILQKIRITNSNPLFSMVYKSIKTGLPERVRNIIEITEDSKFF